jgi:choline dehydrogenase-like flavoprotein
VSGPNIVDAWTDDVTTTQVYDVVIVGGGVTGALMAKRLSDAGRSVLVLEAGTNRAGSLWGYFDDLTTFYLANAKDPESPYPFNPDAPQPSVLDIGTDGGYFVQQGPLPFGSSYARTMGGTTLHWLGTCLRMLPEDFELYTRFGRGRDWPISYDDLAPYYAAAEYALGVSADVEDQGYLGIEFPPGYVYPMHKVPQSHLDHRIKELVGDLDVRLAGQNFPVTLTSTPAARNSTPNAAAGGYRPIGAPGGYGLGERCAGNTNCVPICPIQAKYNSFKTWDTVRTDLVTVAVQAVATRVLYDAETGRVTGIEYQAYADPDSPRHVVRVARGTTYVLAAHAVENAKLLLASNAATSSDQVGRNLMDHPDLLMWGLASEKLWSARGPLSTSGFESMRGGAFRTDFAAFRIELGNEGWLWPTGGLLQLPQDLVDDEGLFGTALRERIADEGPRQVRIGMLMEQLPESGNRVTIDPLYRDAMGNFRPVIHYDLSDYTREGIKQAHAVGSAIFERAGIADHTVYSPKMASYFTYEGTGYMYYGAGHFAGTHLMGTDRHTSVVDRDQRAWDHPNLFLTGCGNMPTIATSNPTLTASALALWCAENVLADLGSR